jgi:hypothetical protein
MRTATFLIGLTFLAAAAPEARAQDRPDFSGSWALAESSGGMGGRMMAGAPPGARQGQTTRQGQGGGVMMIRGGLGREVTLTQTGRTLVVVQATPQGEIRSTYNLDASPSRNTLTLGDRRTEIVSTARWEDNALVIITPNPAGAEAGETIMTLTLDGDGNLIVDTLRTGAAAAAEPSRGVYRRQ